ncbi:MAG: hypothetical protein ACLUL2_12065 [Blautia sp.]
MNATARAMALDYAPRYPGEQCIAGADFDDMMMDEIHTYPEGEKRDAF